MILNPAARAATPDEVREIVGGSAEIRTTHQPGDGVTLARRAVSEGFATVIAAGGDGTLNEVVNGLVTAGRGTDERDRPTVQRGVVCGVLPLGTGNDFARTIDVPLDPAQAWRTIQERRLRKVDVVALERGAAERWFINMAVGGDVDQVHGRLTEDVKQRWGPLAYLRAGAEALAVLLTKIGPHCVEIRLDGGAPIELEAWSIAVANGRTVGGGIPVAPLAEVTDGLLDVVVVPGVRGVEMAKVAAAILLGRHLDQPADLVAVGGRDGAEGAVTVNGGAAAANHGSDAKRGAKANGGSAVLFHRARTIEVRATPPMPFTTDGEVNPAAESLFIAHPAALEMIVGPSSEKC